jgi:hypothetical protein
MLRSRRPFALNSAKADGVTDRIMKMQDGVLLIDAVNPIPAVHGPTISEGRCNFKLSQQRCEKWTLHISASNFPARRHTSPCFPKYFPCKPQ